MDRTAGRSESKAAGGYLLLVLLAALTLPLQAQSTRGASTFKRASRRVLVSIPDCKLAVLEDGKVLRTFSVAVGASVSPSPTGEFRIVHRLANPIYYHPGVVIPPGADNPLGPRWVGLDQKGFGIHGTNAPSSIGKAASHGCIRMCNRDIEQFFELVSVGDTVAIRGGRDKEIAEIFGGEVDASVATVAQPEAASTAGGGQ